MTQVIENQKQEEGANASANFNATAVAKQKRELTAEQKEKSKRLEEQVRKSYEYFDMKDGEEFIIRTNIDKIDWKKVPGYQGKGEVSKYVINVTIPNWDQFKDYIWKLSGNTATN